MEVNNNYVTEAPSLQNTVNLFAGTWASLIPGEGLVTGTAGLFEDGRIDWLVENRGRFDGQTVLELGPLEAGHSYMLEKAGAASVTAIEANTIAYMKCLIVKEILGLERVKFLLGDFDKYLALDNPKVDFLLASGVLYHMPDPLVTLTNMMRNSDEILIWSHFFDDAAMPAEDPRRAAFTGETKIRELDGDTLTYHIRSYGGSNHHGSFSGGIMSESVWMEKHEVVLLLQKHGYQVTLYMEHDGHPNGPAACLYAKR